MVPEVVNKNKNCAFNGPYAGRDLYITMYQDNEREFVVTHNANIKPVSYFTGRETELQELRQRIEAGRKSVLVSGMGGIGKTHICRKLFEEYINRHAEDKNSPFRHIGYIEYNGDMGSSLQNCLKFKQQDSPEQDQEAAWRELEYLSSDGKLLLFIDNVDRPIGEDSGLQRLKGIPGAVVLTSRQVSFSDEFESYRIGFLGMEQCVEIYEKIRFEVSGRKIDPGEVGDLEYVIENLAGRHTITVELLAHLARTKSWSVKKLREELEQKGFRLEFHKEGELVNIQESYEKLYDLSGLTETEQNILEAFSVFPYIPLAAEICNQWLLADAGASEDDDILMGLYQKGWLQFDLEQERYALHPVFAQFIYEKCSPMIEGHKGMVEACQSCLKIPESGLIIKCQRYIPFAEEIIQKGFAKREEFIDTLAYLLMYIGRYAEAKKWFKMSLEICTEIHGENYYDNAMCYNNLATIYFYQGNYKKAEILLEKGLKIYENVSDEDISDIIVSYNNMAYVYSRQEMYRKAIKFFIKSLKISESMSEKYQNDIANSYEGLSDVYYNQGEYEKAEKFCIKCLKIKEKIYGKEHPNTALIYKDLAYLYQSRGKYNVAKEMYKKSLKIYENIFGDNNLEVASNVNGLANIYFIQRKIEMAEELYMKSLKIRENVLGKTHPETADSYNNLALLYCYKKKYRYALDYYLRAYKIWKNIFGLKHSCVQSVYFKIQMIFFRFNPRGNFEQWLEQKLKE